MEITDKELLAICNLSNLKMEFADIVKETDDEGNIVRNHTIYSLLELSLIHISEPTLSLIHISEPTRHGA